MLSKKKNKKEKQIIQIVQKEAVPPKQNFIQKKALLQNKLNQNLKEKTVDNKSNKQYSDNNSLQKKEKKIKKILKIKNSSKETSLSEDAMKEMLKGEPHTASTSTVKKKVTFLEDNTEEKTQKKEIIIRPREYYLKEKLNTMKSKFSQNLLSNINKELFSQVNSIKKQLSDNDIKITEIPKNLNKLLPKSKVNEKSFSFNSSPNLFLPVLKSGNTDEFYVKKNYKNLRNLREEQNLLKKNLMKICENEKLLENENAVNDFNNNYKVDYNIKMKHLKNFKSQKNDLIEKIKILDAKINNLISKDMSSNLPKNAILKNFLQNFNRDTELSQILSHKYIIESNKRKARMSKEINSLNEKTKKEMKLKEKEADTQKEENLLKFKEQQKSIELKQLKDKEKKTLKCKPYIRDKPEKNINSYLFKINQKKYLKNEENLLLKENIKRKEIMKAMNFQELKEFADNYDEQKNKNEENNKFKKEKLIKEWKERKSFIPTFKSQSFELLDNDIKEKDEDNKSKEIQRENLIKIKKDYSQQVKEQYTPTINQELHDKRINIIKELEKPISEKYKNESNIRNRCKKKKKIIFKKLDPSKFSWKLKLEEDAFDKMNNSDMDMRYLVKRPKKVNMFSIYNQPKEILKKNNNLIDSKINGNSVHKNIEKNKWDKAIENRKNNIYENMVEIRKEAEKKNKKALEGEQLLRVSGGIKNNIELGQDVTSLLIDSIEAKLSILNKLRK